MNSLIQQVMHAYYQRDTEQIQRLVAGAVVRDQSTQRRINTLAEALAPYVPQEWLREAIEAHFSGKPVPPMEIK
jgi:hypothetical protein